MWQLMAKWEHVPFFTLRACSWTHIHASNSLPNVNIVVRTRYLVYCIGSTLNEFTFMFYCAFLLLSSFSSFNFFCTARKSCRNFWPTLKTLKDETAHVFRLTRQPMHIRNQGYIIYSSGMINFCFLLRNLYFFATFSQALMMIHSGYSASLSHQTCFAKLCSILWWQVFNNEDWMHATLMPLFTIFELSNEKASNGLSAPAQYSLQRWSPGAKNNLKSSDL